MAVTLPPAAPVATCRFLQNNRIQALASLVHLPALNTLNVNNNEISKLLGLNKCSLETLLCAQNKLATASDIAHLAEVTTLQTLDLQNNMLEDTDILEVFKAMPQLKCLYLKGNPVVSKISNYRCTSALTQLSGGCGCAHVTQRDCHRKIACILADAS